MSSCGFGKFSVAPMLDWTDRHCRYFFRLLSKKAVLYTEMLTTSALLYGEREKLLTYAPEEKPLVLQLGGNDHKQLAECAKFAESAGYDEVNLNIGCPSSKVQNGCFGAAMMATPKLVANCVSSMQDAVSIPVTVKHRIGLSGNASFSALQNFVDAVASVGCRTFIVHARVAVLTGLSPKKNREIPQLRYDWVYRLKQVYPDLNIIINGGIKTFEEINRHYHEVDGVMVGREAYRNPWMLSYVDSYLDSSYAEPVKNRKQIIMEMLPYIEKHIAEGGSLHHVVRHMYGLYYREVGGRSFRRYLSEHSCKKKAGVEVLLGAINQVDLNKEKIYQYE